MSGTRRRPMVAVIGPAAASPEECRHAVEMGREIATRGWILLSGGRDAGVMAAANRGAREAGGLTVGILPDEGGSASPYVEVVLRSGLGSARNNVIALSADVLVACGAGAGTTSEIALGIKAGRPVILLGADEIVLVYFRRLGGNLVHAADSAARAATMIDALLSGAA